MLLLKFLVLTVLNGFLVQTSESVLAEAIKHGLDRSFNESADVLHVVIETYSNKNTEYFLDTVGNILMKEWTFKWQIDVNNEDGQSVSDHNLWFIDSLDAFRRLLPWIRNYHRDSQLFYFIVLKTSKFEGHLYPMQEIFSDFLKLMIANVNIIVEKNIEEVLFHTFYPFQENACRSTKPFILNSYIKQTMKHSVSFFPSKARNFHACSLRMNTRNPALLNLANYSTTLMEVVIVKELSSKLNFNLETIISEIPILLNQHYIGSHMLFANGEIDATLGLYALTTQRNQFLSKSVTYLMSSVVIAFQRRSNVLRRQIWFLVSFDSTLWTCTLLSFAIIAGCIVIVKKSRRFQSVLRLQHHRFGVLDLLAVSIGASAEHLPKKNRSRFVFIVLSFEALILRASYEGKLFDAYRGFKILKPPLSIKELLAENYTIHSNRYYEYLINDMSKDMGTLQFEELGSKNFKDLFGNGEKNAFVAQFTYINTIFNPDERRDMIVKTLIGEQLCIFFPQHSIILPRVNKIIRTLEEAGILRHLRKIYENRDNSALSQKKNSQEPKPLVLIRLVFTFYLLGVMHAIGCLVFAGEILWNRFGKK